MKSRGKAEDSKKIEMEEVEELRREVKEIRRGVEEMVKILKELCTEVKGRRERDVWRENSSTRCRRDQ